jgi:ssDNA-binding Zn-finger/Zn-ribbon topoisomerase 1
MPVYKKGNLAMNRHYLEKYLSAQVEALLQESKKKHTVQEKDGLCPKCHGNFMYLDYDQFGWYYQCIACGYLISIDKII